MEETLKYDLFPIITDELKFLYRLKSINEVYNYISLRFAIENSVYICWLGLYKYMGNGA